MSEPYQVRPDGDFLHRILDEGGEDLKKCFQCAACSVVCELSGDRKPFPRKEMIWAQWGLKDRLLADPDVWLCYQCNDCSTRCPRGARPGDVMAAVRRESVICHSVPSFLGRWVSQLKYMPLLLLIPVVLLGLIVLVDKGPVDTSEIIYSYWWRLPHWVLISFFGVLSALVLLAVVAGVARFWRAMKAADTDTAMATPAKGLWPSILSVLGSIVVHEKFTMCTTERSRLLSHLGVFYGFIALLAVAAWVVVVSLTAGFNPLVSDGLVYPFNFFNPWRMLANLGGLALVAGCLWMIWERLREDKKTVSTYFDWALVGTLLLVGVTGFASEGLHYLRLEPHRYIAYFAHLVFVFALFAYLPYGKFAHLIYRATAMVYAEHTGRNSQAVAEEAVSEPEQQPTSTAVAE